MLIWFLDLGIKWKQKQGQKIRKLNKFCHTHHSDKEIKTRQYVDYCRSHYLLIHQIKENTSKKIQQKVVEEKLNARTHQEVLSGFIVRLMEVILKKQLV